MRRREDESAAIDGANRWQKILHVTLPGLKPTIITLTLMSVGRIFYSDFGLFYQVPMNSGPLIDVTNAFVASPSEALTRSDANPSKAPQSGAGEDSKTGTLEKDDENLIDLAGQV